MVDGLRGADLLHPALVHHRDPVRHCQRLFLVVRHVDERDADLPLDALELELHRLPELQIERAQRLVQEEGARIVDQRARQRHALLLPARELRRLPARVLSQPHDREELLHPARRLLRAHLLAPGAEGDVVGDGHVGEERVVLEHSVHVAAIGRDPRHVPAVEQDPAVGGLLEPRDHPKRRRLAATRRPEQRKELAALDREVGVLHGHVTAEPLDDMLEGDDRIPSAPVPARVRPGEGGGTGIRRDN